MKKLISILCAASTISLSAFAGGFVPEYQYDSGILVSNLVITGGSTSNTPYLNTGSPWETSPPIPGFVNLHGSSTDLGVFVKIINTNNTTETHNLTLTWLPAIRLQGAPNGFLRASNSAVTQTFLITNQAAIFLPTNGSGCELDYYSRLTATNFIGADGAILASLTSADLAGTNIIVTVVTGTYH